jgi:hypothetical protein
MADQENVIYDYGPEKAKRDQSSETTSCYGISEDNITGGFIMVGFGVFIMLLTLGVIDGGISALWPMIFVVPGLSMLVGTMVFFLRRGYLDKQNKDNGFGGMFMTILGMMLLLGLGWKYILAMLFIVPGIGMLIGWIDD